MWSDPPIHFLARKSFFAVFIRFIYELPPFHFPYDEGRPDEGDCFGRIICRF
jgi:hypothetical protein